MWARDDDDLEPIEPEPDRTWQHRAAMAAVLAGAAALATGLAEWAVDELRQRWGTKPKKPRAPKKEP